MGARLTVEETRHGEFGGDEPRQHFRCYSLHSHTGTHDGQSNFSIPQAAVLIEGAFDSVLPSAGVGLASVTFEAASSGASASADGADGSSDGSSDGSDGGSANA